jgi:hypothetical protein
VQTFLYFIPDRPAIKPDEAAALGLGYAFERGLGIDCVEVQGGPDGRNGIVIAQQDAYLPGQLAYRKKLQNWRKFPDRDVWVGFYSDAPPGPEDLARTEQRTGIHVPLNDGRRWLVPLARSHSESPDGSECTAYQTLIELPDFGPGGRLLPTRVPRESQALFDLAEAWLRVRDGAAGDDDHARFDYHGRLAAAAFVLQTNYRLGLVEAVYLELLSLTKSEQVLDALIDLDTLLAWCRKSESKKKAEASPSPAGYVSSAGPAAEILITAPP